MKKIFVAAIMAVATLTANAQQAEGTFSITPKVGMNVATITKYNDADPRIGLVAGAEGQYQVNEMLGISAGVLYSMQGAKHKSGGVTHTTKLDYINVPVLANVYVWEGLAVKAGVQFGFNVNSESKLSGDGGSATGSVDAETFDFSIPVGVSYEFAQVPIVLDARYNWGLTKVWKDTDCKNSVFQFTVGYKFSL